MTKIQTFDVKGGPHLGRKHIPLLRKEMGKRGLDAFLIPHEDEYQNEYIPEAFDRLAWATGFTGSAGAAIVLMDSAAMFTDGRYTLQVREQACPKIFEYCDLMGAGVAGFIQDRLKPGQKIGYDPKLFSPDALTRLDAAAKSAGAMLVAQPVNPIDAVWTNRPPEPKAKVVAHPVAFAGKTSEAKRRELGEDLTKAGLAAALITNPASIAWLFNVRGGDLRCTPLPLATAILRANGEADLFLDPDKVTPDLPAWLGNEVALKRPEDLADGLKALKGVRVRADPGATSAWHFSALAEAGAEIERGMDPVALPRARKNAVEIEGARQAHARDGVALTRFLHWLATEAQSGAIDEITACMQLEDFRRELKSLKDLSFESISGAGPNGALPHYRVSVQSNRKLKRGSLFLIDSGGQYQDGTTDVTRTVAIGRPTKEMKERFTLVLKGHIALSVIRFPPGVTGAQLDTLARMALWAAGLDYDHGTGHGVGSYLGVHEGPQRIAKPPNPQTLQPLEPGMIVSNEPGYYKADSYGIRTENLQVVTPPAPIPGGEREMLGFETLTLAPIDRTLIVKALLTKAERDWLDAYHARVLAEIGPNTPKDVRAWLEEVCKPI